MILTIPLFVLLLSFAVFSRFFYQKLSALPSNGDSLSFCYIIPKRFYLYFLFFIFSVCVLLSAFLFKKLASETISTVILYLLFCAFFFTIGFKLIRSLLVKIIERIISINMLLFSTTSVIAIVLIFYSIFVNSYSFFGEVGVMNFLFKTNWSPESYQIDPQNSFGIVPLVINTLYIMLFSVIISCLFGVFVAIYMSEYIKQQRIRFLLKSVFEVAAGIPSIFYGFFGAFILAPKISSFGNIIGIDISIESIIVPGIAIGIMMIPYVATLLDDAFSSIPKTLKDASFAMGLTKFETVKNLIIPISFPEIISALIIVVSRVLGETMIVLLTCGIVATMTLSPFNPSTTITVQIVHLLTGDTSFDTSKTLSVFALSLFLFIATMILNILSIKIKNSAKSL